MALRSRGRQIAKRIDRLSLPANLEVPAGNVPFLITRAEGTQNYVCVPSGPSFVWAFFGPQATLLNENNQQVHAYETRGLRAVHYVVLG